MNTLRTQSRVTADGDQSKSIVITLENGSEIVIALGVEEARALSAALKPAGKNINFNGREMLAE